MLAIGMAAGTDKSAAKLCFDARAHGYPCRRGPAAWLLSMPMTLPMSLMVLAPLASDGTSDELLQLCVGELRRHVGLDHFDLGLFLVRQVLTVALLNCATDSRRCFSILSSTTSTWVSSSTMRSSTSRLFYGREDQTDHRQEMACRRRAWRPSCRW